MKKKMIELIRNSLSRYENTKDLTYLIDALGVLRTLIFSEQDKFKQTYETSDYKER